jgi:hypothetical protein
MDAKSNDQFSVGGWGHRSAQMSHRPYILRSIKQPLTDTRASTGGSGTPFVAGIVAMTIVLGLVLYGIGKTVIEADNSAATSAPRTTGEGSTR